MFALCSSHRWALYSCRQLESHAAAHLNLYRSATAPTSVPSMVRIPLDHNLATPCFPDCTDLCMPTENIEKPRGANIDCKYALLISFGCPSRSVHHPQKARLGPGHPTQLELAACIQALFLNSRPCYFWLVSLIQGDYAFARAVS